jgi:hypothetical protein
VGLDLKAALRSELSVLWWLKLLKIKKLENTIFLKPHL